MLVTIDHSVFSLLLLFFGGVYHNKTRRLKNQVQTMVVEICEVRWSARPKTASTMSSLEIPSLARVALRVSMLGSVSAVSLLHVTGSRERNG